MKRSLILFLILITTSFVVAQTFPNDCVRAVTICGNGTFYSNASGIGTVREINSASCGGSENNSFWLKINIANTVIPGSTLGFDLIPLNPSTNVDYDFYVFPANAVCGTLGNAIRCCTTNPGPAPFGAALSNNITGINGSTLQTAVGPGPAASNSGDDYVNWLRVNPGQSYYIAIDRPVGNGGFKIQWTGTATSGAGAFSTPPTANSIANVKTCSNTPDVGIFDLDTVRSLINPSTSNTISFHTTISNAIDNFVPLDDIYVNTSNPQPIYVRVTDNLSKCFSINSFNLVVNLVPNAMISTSNTVICNGDSVTISYTGTPGATFDYTIGGGPIQTAIFPATGIFTVTETLTTNRTYTLNGVRNLDSLGVVICNQPLSNSITVTVNQQPDAGIDGTTTICETNTVAIDLFSMITGEQAGGTWTRTSGTGGIFNAGAGTFTSSTGATNSTFTYTLLGTSPCVNDTSLAIININAQPIAGTDGTTTICETDTNVIDLYGLITGEQTGGTWAQTSGTGGVFNIGAGTFTPAVSVTTSTFTYTLLGTTQCLNDTSLATININLQPDAGSDGTTTICETDTNVIDLYDLITGEQIGGTWTRTSGTGGIFNAVAGTFTPEVGATTSTFDFTLIGTSSCLTDTSLATIIINNTPTIATPSDYVVCDDSYNNDGFSCNFDLNTKINEITGGDSTIVVNFYETATSTTAIPLNVNYCSIVPGTQ
ncbi:MAG: hypothetical protein NT048_08005, partial [Flavobacterium sp.]|nr:hypothetical protein [Flavobacterium sp.]